MSIGKRLEVSTPRGRLTHYADIRKKRHGLTICGQDCTMNGQLLWARRPRCLNRWARTKGKESHNDN